MIIIALLTLSSLNLILENFRELKFIYMDRNIVWLDTF